MHPAPFNQMKLENTRLQKKKAVNSDCLRNFLCMEVGAYRVIIILRESICEFVVIL